MAIKLSSNTFGVIKSNRLEIYRDWVIRHGYDYLFAVDSDMAFAPDTLVKLLSADKDIVSGLYIQRIRVS